MDQATQTPDTPISDGRYVLFSYQGRKGTKVVVGASLAWLVAIIVLALVRPEVFAIPAGLTAVWKYLRG